MRCGQWDVPREVLVGPALVTGEGRPAARLDSTACARLMLRGAHLGSAGARSRSLSCLLGGRCDSWTVLIAYLG